LHQGTILVTSSLHHAFLSIAFPCPTHIAILKNHDQSRNPTASETHPHKTQHPKTPQSVEEDQTLKYAIARDKKKKKVLRWVRAQMKNHT
jgi:hypothetical protein